jgi:hypothetical protein
MKRASVLLLGGLAALALVSVRALREGPEPAAPSAAEAEAEPSARAPAELRAEAPEEKEAAAPAASTDVGPCPAPYAEIPVVRSGHDELGRPTWWHADGSRTTRVIQIARKDGEAFEVPAVMHLRPMPRR